MKKANIIKNLLLAVATLFLLQGCNAASYFTLGKNQTACEEEGCDYSDAGVCIDPYEIIANKSKANKDAYTKIMKDN